MNEATGRDEGGPWSVLSEQGACARLCEAVDARGGSAAECAALIRARQAAAGLALAPGADAAGSLSEQLARLTWALTDEDAALAAVPLWAWRSYFARAGWSLSFRSGGMELWEGPPGSRTAPAREAGENRAVSWAPWTEYGTRSAYDLPRILRNLAEAERRAPALVLADLLARAVAPEPTGIAP